jgi:hypothetical protein
MPQGIEISPEKLIFLGLTAVNFLY